MNVETQITSTFDPFSGLRVKVAELCGWTDLQPSSLNPSAWVGRKPGAYDIEGRTFLPDFCNDLNACHEFEKGLTVDQAWVYSRELSALQGTAGGIGSGAISQWPFHATAEQRCQAFVKASVPKDADSVGRGNEKV